MKIPRNVSGAELSKALEMYGYFFARQRGSHMRHTTKLNGEHHIVIPDHSPMKIGTLNTILKAVASHHGTTVELLLRDLGL